jgi:hypothetical protein
LGICIELRRAGFRVRIAHPETVENQPACKHGFARTPCEQRSMYHICAAQCQIQLSRCKCSYRHNIFRTLAKTPFETGRDLARSVGTGITCVQERDDRIDGNPRLDLGEAGEDLTVFVGDC